MKKSIRIFILSVVSPLVISACVFAFPFFSHAATRSADRMRIFDFGISNSSPLVYSGTVRSSDSVVFSYTDNCFDYDTSRFEPVFTPNSTTLGAIEIFLCYTNHQAQTADVSVDFSFVYNRIRYYGNAILTNVPSSSYYRVTLHSNQVSSEPVVDPVTTNTIPVTDFVKLMYEDINNTANKVVLASKGLAADGSVNATKTVTFKAEALSKIIMKALVETDGVTLFYTYTYEGYEFCSAITSDIAKLIYREEIEWYGPCYIANNCPTVMVGPAI